MRKKYFKKEKRNSQTRVSKGGKSWISFPFYYYVCTGKNGKGKAFFPSFSAFLFRFRYLVTQEDGRTHLFLPLFLAFFYLLLLSWKMGKRRDGSVPSFEIQWGKGGTYILWKAKGYIFIRFLYVYSFFLRERQT